MTEANNFYEKLVVEEEELVMKVQLCEGYQWTILTYLSNQGEIAKEIGEEILTIVHTIEQDLRTELLHLRVEKELLGGMMKRQQA
ncbi:MAG: hypothetical protein K6T85_04480 [Gorillibacterium sp.]|nr:hypothetical protein [Gorillibacterium sp.]